MQEILHTTHDIEPVDISPNIRGYRKETAALVCVMSQNQVIVPTLKDFNYTFISNVSKNRPKQDKKFRFFEILRTFFPRNT